MVHGIEAQSEASRAYTEAQEVIVNCPLALNDPKKSPKALTPEMLCVSHTIHCIQLGALADPREIHVVPFCEARVVIRVQCRAYEGRVITAVRAKHCWTRVCLIRRVVSVLQGYQDIKQTTTLLGGEYSTNMGWMPTRLVLPVPY